MWINEHKCAVFAQVDIGKKFPSCAFVFILAFSLTFIPTLNHTAYLLVIHSLIFWTLKGPLRTSVIHENICHETFKIEEMTKKY